MSTPARKKKSTGPGLNGRAKKMKEAIETPPPAPPPAPPPEQPLPPPPPPFIPFDTKKEWDYVAGRYKSERPISAADLVDREQEWYWHPYIPRGLMTMVVGDSTAGKSTMLATVAARVSVGREMSGRGGNPPAKVLFYSGEDDPQTTVRPRLLVADALLRNVFFGGFLANGKPAPRLLLPNDLGRLADIIRDLGVQLVILDPITAFLASGIDQNKDQQIRELIDGLTQTADETGAMILASKNYRKSREGGPLDWVGGAPAWTQLPRVVLACGHDPDDPTQRVLACSKNTLAKDAKSLRFVMADKAGVGVVRFGEECELTAEDLGAGGLAPHDRDALGDAVAFLLDELANEMKGVKLVRSKADDMGISRGTLQRAKHKLGIKSHVTGPNNAREWLWGLPMTGGAKPPSAGA